LPFLARLLYDENSPDRLVNHLFQLAHVGESLWLSSWLLAPALSVARKCETRWDEMERDHVLDRDYFAYLCGQGKRLRIALRHQLNDRIQQNQPDNAIPTLVERIDHLDSLIGREARQVKKLRDAALPPGPSSEPPTPTEPESDV